MVEVTGKLKFNLCIVLLKVSNVTLYNSAAPVLKMNPMILRGMEPFKVIEGDLL